MDSATLPPTPGTFAARKLRADSIMRTLADRHEAKAPRTVASGLALLGRFLEGRRTAAVEAAVRRAAAAKG